MNAEQLAEELKIMPDFHAPQAAAMLRKQDDAIKQLREALEYQLNWGGCQHADDKLRRALAATENL